MNIYKGCCHGCIYCDSRSDCYQIDDFDKVRAKEDALRIIRDDLRRKVKRGVVGTGAMSDPYNPFEKKLELTRHALELCDAFEFGAAVATKNTIMERDLQKSTVDSMGAIMSAEVPGRRGFGNILSVDVRKEELCTECRILFMDIRRSMKLHN